MSLCVWQILSIVITKKVSGSLGEMTWWVKPLLYTCDDWHSGAQPLHIYQVVIPTCDPSTQEA